MRIVLGRIDGQAKVTGLSLKQVLNGHGNRQAETSNVPRFAEAIEPAIPQRENGQILGCALLSRIYLREQCKSAMAKMGGKVRRLCIPYVDGSPLPTDHSPEIRQELHIENPARALECCRRNIEK